MNTKLIIILGISIISFGCMGFNVGGTFTYNLITCEERPVKPDSPLPTTPDVIAFSPQYGGNIAATLGFFIEYATFPVTLPVGLLGGSVWGLISIPETRVLQVARNPKTPKEKLIELSKDSNPNVRIEVAWNESTPIEIVNTLAQDPDDNVRKYSTLALGGQYNDAEFTIPVLIKNLSDPSTEVRYAATKALSQYGSQAKPAIPDLVKALKDPEIPVQLGALEALGEIRYFARKAIPDIEVLLDSPDQNVVRAAIKAIERISGKIDEEE